MNPTMTKRVKTGLNKIHKFLNSASIRKTVYRNNTYYCLNDIVLKATNSVNPKDYIKKLRHRDRVLSIEWPDLIKILPGDTDGGPQSMKFVDLLSFLRIIQCIPGIEAHELKFALAEIGTCVYNESFKEEAELTGI